MEEEDDGPVTSPSSPVAESRFRIAPSTWVGVAVIGVALFVLGIWTPAWRGVPGGLALSYVAAAGGGVLFIAGLTFAEGARRRVRPTPIEELPGVEVYRPPRTGSAHPTPPPLDEDQP